MFMPTRNNLLACLAIGLAFAAPSGLCASGLCAQDQPAQATKPNKATKPNPLVKSDSPHFIVVRYPQDKGKAIAVVGQKTLRLEELVRHIEERHYPGFAQLLETQPGFQRYLQSDLIAPWVRQFTDLEAIRQFVGEENIDSVELEKAQSSVLKSNFEGYLGKVIEGRRRSGRPEPTQTAVNRLLADFQLRRGLSAELQGMLNYLEKGDFTRKELRDFFNSNARFFGGQVTVQHILVQHRDGGTGILLKDEGIARANARVAEIKARLRPDGANFEQLVRLFSDDQRTAQSGGELSGIHRFDDRLPATICRSAWKLRDGEVSDDVVESQYGWHFVRRLAFAQQVFILFTDDAIPSIRVIMRRAMQEQLLFKARNQAKLRLLL